MAVQNERSQVFGLFKEEASEYIQHMHRGLLALRHQMTNQIQLAEVVRLADALMGSAVTISQDEIGENAREMRDLLIAARDAKLSLDESKLEMLFESLRTTGSLIDAVAEKKGGGQAADISQTTVMEARCLVDELYQGLLQVLQDPHDTAITGEVLPRATALKERSEEEGLEAVARIAQRIESILDADQADQLEINREVIGLLLQSIGFMEIVLHAAATGLDSAADVSKLCGLLDEVLSRTVGEPVGMASTAAEQGVLAAEPVRPKGTQKNARPDSHKGDGKREKKVLIAANSPLFSRELSEALRHRQIEFILSSDADEMASRLEKKDVALCFLRDSLPHGLDVCERFAKSASAKGSVPIIVFSPLSRAKKLASEKGASGFLKVPCKSDDVFAVVDRWVNTESIAKQRHS